MNFQTIILAAGKGTRMNSDLPKVLVPLKGKPLIRHLVDSVSQLPTDFKPIIVVGHKAELVRTSLGSEYLYAVQDGQFGTGHALAAGLPRAEAENILVLYGDKPFIKPATLRALIEQHISKRALFSMLTMTSPNFEQENATFYGDGRIIRDEQGNFQAIREFAAASETERQIKETNPGFYIFNRQWLEKSIRLIPKNKIGEYYLTDLVEIAVKAGLDILTVPSEPREVYGINTPEQLEQAENF